MTLRIFFLSLILSPLIIQAAPVKQWQTYEGYNAPGYGRHVVLISGDEEYRSEETLSQLGKILAVRHGFRCTVLYAQDPEAPGVINPQHLTHIPGLEALRSAQLMIIATRFRALPDDQMQEINDYLLSGRPVIGLRTANHGFRFPNGSKWEHYNWQYHGPKTDWNEGFGGLVLGSWFFSHHGWHGHESTRGVAEPANRNHEILKGFQAGAVWGATDVYGVKEPIPGRDVEILLHGQVLAGMEPDSEPLGPGPYEKAPDYVVNGTNNKNDPMQVLAWTKSYQLPGGRKGRAFCTTLGASLDLEAEGTRKLLVNAASWCLGMECIDPDVTIVDEFTPSPFKTHPRKYWEERKLMVSDFDLKTAPYPSGKEAQGEPLEPYFDVTGGREGFGYDFASHPINRHRLYQFYRRQAKYYLETGKIPEGGIVPAFPGLDGGTFGHWGLLNKNDYRDRRWNLMDVDQAFCGILHIAKNTYPRGIAIDTGNGLYASFDPDTKRYTHSWTGGFVTWQPNRWGIGHGIEAGGKPTSLGLPAGVPEEAEYVGFHKTYNGIWFEFRKDGKPYYSHPYNEDGKLAVTNPPELPDQRVDKTAKPYVFTTRASLGKPVPGYPFAIDRIPVPVDNPLGSVMQLSGLDFFSNGDAAICTMSGDVWRVSGLIGDLEEITWRRIASGLNQSLGLAIRDDVIHVIGRDRISRLHDRNGDGRIDFYENFCDKFPSSPGGHDFYTGLQFDAAGYFYFVAANAGVIRVSPDGKATEVLANGLRNADGIGISADGVVITSTNEGDWTPASAVMEVRNGDFYGRQAKKGGKAIAPAMAYLPRGIDNSSGGQIFVDSKKWGPLQDELLHFSYGSGTWMMILRDTDKSERTQGAAVPLPGDFASASHRARFSPLDGQLYVAGGDGWGNYSFRVGSLDRIRFLPDQPNPLPTGWEAHRNGITLQFATPIKTAETGDFFCQTWNYEYGDHYGSLEYSLKQPGTPGHDVLEVTNAVVGDDGYSLFLEIPDLKPAMQCHVFGTLTSGKTGEPFEVNVFPTLLHLGEAFTAEGIQPVPDLTQKPDSLTLPVRWSVPYTPKVPSGKPGRVISIKAITGLQFDVKQIRAKAGEQLTVEFQNTDSIPHNWVLIEKDSLLQVGDAANKMLGDPKAPDCHFVPQMDEVLHFSPMLYHGKRWRHNLAAPKEPGTYPYICTFPGHWAVMKGELIVE